jgi:hypothetical protein
VRIALISMMAEGAGDVRLAGRPIAWHQLQAALALACERLICLAHAPGPALAALQREAERRGAAFHAVSHHRALSGLVSAADTLLVFAPGVLAERDWLTQAFGARSGVAVLPAAGAVEHGFERIDRDRAWAGFLAARGDAVEALATLAPDADPIGGLLRVALQRGAGTVEVPEAWLDDGRWALVMSSAGADRYQAGWYARHVPAPPIDRPGAALAYRGARLLLERTGNPARSALAFSVGGAFVAACGGVAGYLGSITWGVAALATGSVLLAVGQALSDLSRAGSGDRVRRWPVETRRALLDLSLIAITLSPSIFEGWAAAFAAFVLVAVMRLAHEPGVPRALRPLSDRTVVCAALTALAAAGLFAPGMASISVAGLAVRLFAPRPRS